jgi:hypothetical protein
MPLQSRTAHPKATAAGLITQAAISIARDEDMPIVIGGDIVSAVIGSSPLLPQPPEFSVGAILSHPSIRDSPITPLSVHPRLLPR